MRNAPGTMFYPERNFMGLPPELTVRDQAAALVLPIPYDNTSEIKGSARGPWAIIDASQELELYEPDLDDDPSARGIHTLPGIEPYVGDPEEMARRIEEAVLGLDLGDRFLLTLGGEHGVTLGVVRALRARYPRLSVLHVDAHADMRDEYQGTRFSHAAIARRLREMCPVSSIGLRSYSREEAQVMQSMTLRPITATEVLAAEARGEHSWLDRALADLSEDVYVTIDLDVLDPGVFPAVAFPEPGGLGWPHLTELLARIGHVRRIIGGDVVELCPDLGPRSCAVVAARIAYRLIGEATRA